MRKIPDTLPREGYLSAVLERCAICGVSGRDRTWAAECGEKALPNALAKSEPAHFGGLSEARLGSGPPKPELRQIAELTAEQGWCCERQLRLPQFS
jgi:hypothetical protein